MRVSGRLHVDVLRLLLEARALPDASDSDGSTALMAAACRGSAEVVQLLLDAGAQKDLCDSEGRTVLMTAAWCGHLSVVRVLLESRAQVDLCDDSGSTALILGSPDLVPFCFFGVPLLKPNSRTRDTLLLRGYWGTLKIEHFKEP